MPFSSSSGSSPAAAEMQGELRPGNRATSRRNRLSKVISYRLWDSGLGKLRLVPRSLAAPAHLPSLWL